MKSYQEVEEVEEEVAASGTKIKPMSYHQNDPMGFSIKLHQNPKRGSYNSMERSDYSLRLGGGLCLGLVHLWTNLFC